MARCTQVVGAQAMLGLVVAPARPGQDAVPAPLAGADAVVLSTGPRSDVPPPALSDGGSLPTAVGRPVQVVASAGHGRLAEEVRRAAGRQAPHPQAAAGGQVGGSAVHAVAARRVTTKQGPRSLAAGRAARPVRRAAARS